MRLATWNVNSLTARFPRVLELLAEHRPDVACLQETKVADTAFPQAELDEAGYAAVHHSAGRWAGVALLARRDWPLEGPQTGLPGESVAAEARWVEATVAGLRVASVYVPNGRVPGSPTFDQKLAFLDAMLARAPALDVILGDFNVTPSDLDVYDPAAFVGSTHVTEAERSRVAALVDAGFVDVFRRLHPEESGYTWWDYRAGHFHRRMGLRIDLALVRSALAERVVACAVQRAYRKGPKPSDHAPLIIDLDEAAGG